MKFTCSAEIEKPRELVVELFKNPGNLKHWQDGFIRIEPQSGTPGEEGAKTKMFYKFGKKEMELLETLQKVDGPFEYHGLYEHEHMSNTLRTTFTENGNKTIVTQEAEYIRFQGFIPKLLMRFFPGMFRKQAQKWLDQFKAFAEKQE